MKFSLSKIYFLLSAIAFLAFVVLCQVFDIVKTSPLGLQIAMNALLAISFYGLLEGFNKAIGHQTVAGSIEKIFRNLIVFGFIALFSFATVVFVSYFTPIAPPIKQTLILLGLGSCIVYITYAFVLYKKLVFLRSSTRLVKTWNSLNILIYLGLIALIFYYLNPDFFLVINAVFLGLSALAGIFIIPNNKWIAFIDKKTKIISIFYLILLLLITVSIALFVKLIDINPFVRYNLVINNYIITILGFFIAYNLFSLLTLIFNWPLFSTLESQMQAIKDFQLVNQQIIKKQERTDLYTWLFEVSNKACAADAAYLHIYNSKEERQVAQTSINLSPNLCHQLKEKVEWRSLRDPLTYFPSLKEQAFQIDKFESALIVTLSYEDRRLAHIILFKRIIGGFDQYMLDLVESYINQAQLLLKDADLLEKNIRNQNYQSELNTARRVQRALFPTEYPKNDKYEISGFNESASEVGGDYFDFLELEDGRLAVIMADVCGSGTSAALYMSELKGIFQAMTRMNLPLELILNITNDALYSCMEAKSFITLTFCFFDFENKTLEYARAGHTPLIHYSVADNNASFFNDDGMGVGMFNSKIFIKHTKTYLHNINPGDIYVLYTDGLSEEKNTKGEPYGDERIRFGVNKYKHLSCEEIIASLLNDQVIFCDEFGKTDDKSLLVIKIKQ